MATVFLIMLFVPHYCGDFKVLRSAVLLAYIPPVNRLTKQEQFVVWVVIGLVVMGVAVRAFRPTLPPATVSAKE